MIAALRDSLSSSYPRVYCWVLSRVFPCKTRDVGPARSSWTDCRRPGLYYRLVSRKVFRLGLTCRASFRFPIRRNDNPMRNSVRQSVKIRDLVTSKHQLDELNYEESSAKQIQMMSNFTNFLEDPMVDKLRNQLGVMHPIPSPPINRNVVGLLIFFFFFGIVFDKLWTWRERRRPNRAVESGIRPQVPTSFTFFLEKDLQRKESVEWVNMVLEKLWKVYKEGIENWIVGLLQPVIDDLMKPEYVRRVEIKQFSLGNEPLSVRNVERRTFRRANDLQYQIGLRYTGGARMLLSLSLKVGIIPIVVPVGIRDFDIDGELWVKLRLIQSEPWIGAVSWAFVSLPKIKFELAPFRLFNLMGMLYSHCVCSLSSYLLCCIQNGLPFKTKVCRKFLYQCIIKILGMFICKITSLISLW